MAAFHTDRSANIRIGYSHLQILVKLVHNSHSKRTLQTVQRHSANKVTSDHAQSLILTLNLTLTLNLNPIPKYYR